MGTSAEAQTIAFPEAGVQEAAAAASLISRVDECRAWWLFVLLWLLVSSGIYLLGGSQRAWFIGSFTQLAFWIASLVLLIASLLLDLDCAWWPAVAVGVGAPLVYFLSKDPEVEMAIVL